MSIATKHRDEGNYEPEYNVAHVNYPFDMMQQTDHIVTEKTLDCFCEPTLRLHEGELHGVAGPFIIIDHQPIVRDRSAARQYFDPVTRLLDSVQPPPKEGWDAFMANERIDDLINTPYSAEIERIQVELTPLIQSPGESYDDFSARIAAQLAVLAELRLAAKAPEPIEPVPAEIAPELPFSPVTLTNAISFRDRMRGLLGDGAEIVAESDDELTDDDEFDIFLVDDDEEDEEGDDEDAS